jgi:4a-hydroxytetrahydrobiopterin dehydratase
VPLPRRKGPPLDEAAVAGLLPSVPAWSAVDGKRIEREFRFPDFKSALAFAVRVGAVAEAENHHPDLLVAWGKVGVVLTTHSAGGLTGNDFALAGKIDALGVAGEETP